MWNRKYLTKSILSCLVLFSLLLSNCFGFSLDWPEVFDPEILLTLNLEIDPVHWQEIVNDMSVYDDSLSEIKRPAYFWADGEEDQRIYVSVRRKSGDPIPPAFGPVGDKISLKIDINKYHEEDPSDPDYPGHPDSVEMWHGIKKLSLENGDDNNVLAEGFAANVHQLASGPAGYGYDCWRANWVKLYVNGHYYGVYVNAEHLDKTFLKNRNFYVWHQTWLYQYRGEHSFSLEIGDDSNPKSPTVNALNFFPFAFGKSNSPLYPDAGIISPPDDATLTSMLDELIDMQGMIAMAAVNIYAANPDSLFTHERNSHFLDFDTNDPLVSRKRLYFPWDIDAALQSPNSTIYGDSTQYQELLLKETTYKPLYDKIMTDLINGPLSEGELLAFIDRIEPVLRDALAQDPYNQFDSIGYPGVDETFDALRLWVTNRDVSVRSQLGITALDSDGDGISDLTDNCPYTRNASQADSDGDGIGDSCDRCNTECACIDADLDGLGSVEFADFLIMSQLYGKKGSAIIGDIDGNQHVNLNDLAILANLWLSRCP